MCTELPVGGEVVRVVWVCGGRTLELENSVAHPSLSDKNNLVLESDSRAWDQSLSYKTFTFKKAIRETSSRLPGGIEGLGVGVWGVLYASGASSAATHRFAPKIRKICVSTYSVHHMFTFRRNNSFWAS